MAEIVGSAVVQETVSQIISGLAQKYEEKMESNVNKNLERLEMSHIRLEAALEISERWQITDASLLRWRRKLKRAAQECDDKLHKCKQRILEEVLMEQEVRNSSLPNRIAHATKSFIFSAFNRNNEESSISVVRRFEWFADGASEFLRFVELGGTSQHHMPFNPLISHLLTGKRLKHKIAVGNECPMFLLWIPFPVEYGIEVSLIFTQRDVNAPEGNFYLCVTLQLSESTDIIGIVIRCLQLFAPHFKSTIEIIRNKLTQLPTQEFSWLPCFDPCQGEDWGKNIHSLLTQWFRPNPLCCKQRDRHDLRLRSIVGITELPNISLEPVIQVNLQCQVSLSQYNKWRTPQLSECKKSLQDSPHLKVGFLLTPHGSSEDLLPANISSAVAEIDGENQHCLHTNIGLEQLDGIMLPKAIDYFCQNTKARLYQMLWKSKHGIAYIQVEKASPEMRRMRR